MFDPLNRRYKFIVDLCSTDANKLCDRNFTVERSSLEVAWAELSLREWKGSDGWLWCNNPYSKPNLGLFTEKARHEVMHGAAIVQLVPATPGPEWFQKNVFRGHDVIGGGSTNPATATELQGFKVRMKGNGYEVTVTFLKRRVAFLKNKLPMPKNSGAKTDSCLIEWRPRRLI